MKKCLGCSTPFETSDWRCPACGNQPRSAEGLVLHAPDLIEGDGTDADYPFDVLVRAEASHFWFRGRAALIAATIGACFPKARSFMEIGTGGGGVLLELQRTHPALRLVGTELLGRGLCEARKRLAGVELLQMDARRIPFTSEFDVIGAFDVIEHIDADTTVLDEMYAAVAPGGGIVLTVPQHPWLWSAFDEFSGHRRRYTRRELVAKMVSAGFDVVRTTSFTTLALPLLVASRLTRRNRHIDLEQELAIPAVVNRVLLGLGTLERVAIGAGASFPAGGSLLAVGVRRA